MSMTGNAMGKGELKMRDPYLILGIRRDAGDKTVHSAYLAAVKSCPPERDPERFEALRRAYESIRTERDRLAQELFDTTPASALDLLEQAAPAEAPGRPDIETLRALLKDGS